MESGQFEATVISGFFRYASGKLGGLDKGTHTTIKTPTAQIGVRGSEMEGIIEEDGSSTFVHKDGILDVSDANGRGTVTLDEPGMATAVSSKPGAPATAFEAPESLLAPFEEALPPPPEYVEGGEVPVQWALAEYEEPEDEVAGGGGGLAGYVPDDVEFVTEEGVMSLGEAVEAGERLVAAEDRLHCKCIQGYDHGSKYPAFIARMDSGALGYYCSGSRCSKSLELQMVEMDSIGAEELEVKRVEKSEMQPRDYLPQEHAGIYGDKVTDKMR